MDCSSILDKDWQWDYKGIYVKPNIPSKKLKGAINSYAYDVDPNEVLVLLDDTIFGGAKEGLILTKNSMFCKELGQKVKFASFSTNPEISRGTKSTLIVNGEPFFKATMIEHTAMLTFTSRVMACTEESIEAQASHNEQEPVQSQKEDCADKDSLEQSQENPATAQALSFMNSIESDTIFESLSKMNKLNIAFTLTDMLSSKGPSNTDVIEKEFFKFTYGNIKVFRNIIESRNLHALNNDFATLELLSFLMGRFIKDMMTNNINPEYIEFVSNRCLMHVFTNKNKYFPTVFETAVSYLESEQPMIQLLYRLGCSNIEKDFKQEYNHNDYAFSVFPDDHGFTGFIEKLQEQITIANFSKFAQVTVNGSSTMVKQVLDHPLNAHQA